VFTFTQLRTMHNAQCARSRCPERPHSPANMSQQPSTTTLLSPLLTIRYGSTKQNMTLVDRNMVTRVAASRPRNAFSYSNRPRAAIIVRVMARVMERARRRSVAVRRVEMVALVVAGVRRTMIEGIGATEKQIQSLSIASMERIASISHRSEYSRGCACRTAMADSNHGRWGGVAPRMQGRGCTTTGRVRRRARDACATSVVVLRSQFFIPDKTTSIPVFQAQTGSRWLAACTSLVGPRRNMIE
jgi:hypothetical protein